MWLFPRIPHSYDGPASPGSIHTQQSELQVAACAPLVKGSSTVLFSQGLAHNMNFKGEEKPRYCSQTLLCHYPHLEETKQLFLFI